MTFFGQLKDTRKNDNMLYRIFLMIDDDGIVDEYWINKIELSEENIKNQVIIKKPKYDDEKLKDKWFEPEIFDAYEIKGWTKYRELLDLDRIREYFHIPDYKYQEDNTLYDNFNEAYNNSTFKPACGIKVGGTPISTQDQSSVLNYDFLQIEEANYLPYRWGDCGIAHISDKCKLIWDCC